MAYTNLGLKDIFNGPNKSPLSTHGQNGFYRDSAPGTKYPRKDAFAYVNPETGKSETRIPPLK